MATVIPFHALESARSRGVSIAEIEEALSDGQPAAAHSGRSARTKVFRFQADWFGRHYEHKKVTVIYAKQDETTIVVTVMAQYGRWAAVDAH